MAANPYHDERGHYTTQQNDGGPCFHEFSKKGFESFTKEDANTIGDLSRVKSEDLKKRIATYEKEGNPDYVGLLDKYRNKVKSYIQESTKNEQGGKVVYLSPDCEKDTYFHEFGHWLDENSSFIDLSQISHNPMRWQQVSLHEMCKIELRHISSEEVLRILNEEKPKYIQAELEKVNFPNEQFEELSNKYRDFNKKIENEYRNHPDYKIMHEKWLNDEISNSVIDNFRANLWKEIVTKYTEKDPQNASLIRQLTELRTLKNECENKGNRAFLEDYYAVSDVLSSRKELSKYRGLGRGHTRSYYRDRMSTGIGQEFFANVFSLYTRNNKRGIEITRKYFPESMKIFDQRIKEIREHE